jgi:hypothetical protein
MYVPVFGGRVFMRSSSCVVAAGLVVALLCAPSTADAQGTDPQALRQEIDALRKEFEAIQKQYGDRLAALEAKLGSPPGAGTSQVSPTPEVAFTPTAPSTPTANVFNPDMAVIGNLLGAAGRNRVSPSPAFDLAESEVSLQAVVDPYARADFFLSFGQEGVEVEEGFLTFPALPGGLLFRVGKMRAAFGKINTLHRHVVPWTDRPLVTANLVGGEEGISDAGVSVARLIPNPWLFLEATGQAFRGNSAELFTSQRPRDLTYVGRVRAYHDITESTNLDLGTSYARGQNDAGPAAGIDGRFATGLYGIDATVRWKPLQRAIYHSFIGRSELVWSHRQQPIGTARTFGFYASGDYQFARRWLAGLRYDDSGRADTASLRDRGQSAILTYRPSEFGQIRSQYRRIRYAGADMANEVLFQFQFSIGAHGAHTF